MEVDRAITLFRATSALGILLTAGFTTFSMMHTAYPLAAVFGVATAFFIYAFFYSLDAPKT